MATISCTRKFEFDSAHRIINHAGKCRNVHGHRYKLEVTISTSELDEMGMVIDFAVLKEIIKTWLDDHLDHTIILAEADRTLGNAIYDITKQDIYYLNNTPTAENIALHLKDILSDLFVSKGLKTVRIERILLNETPSCSVEVS